MENTHHAKQKHLDARTFTLGDLRTQLPKSPFLVLIRELGELCPDGYLLLAVTTHTHCLPIAMHFADHSGPQFASHDLTEAPLCQVAKVPSFQADTAGMYLAIITNVQLARLP